NHPGAAPPPCGENHRTASPDTTRRSGASAAGRPHSPSPGANTTKSEPPSADGTAPRSTTRRRRGRPATAAQSGSWTRPFPKKITLNRQFADLLIQLGQPRVVGYGAVHSTALALGKQRADPVNDRLLPGM